VFRNGPNGDEVSTMLIILPYIDFVNNHDPENETDSIPFDL
jgi:hypothetical protein